MFCLLTPLLFQLDCYFSEGRFEVMDLRSLLSQCYTDMTLPTPPPVLWDGGYPEEDIRPLKSKHFILQKKLLTWRKKRMGALLVAHTHTHPHTPDVRLHTHRAQITHTHLTYTIHTHAPKAGSVQFSRSVVSDSLRPHEPQHARPPCPSPTPRVHSDSLLSSQ